ncbi:pyrroline-5-carboxylate reductase [Ensifer sp. M14]|uniref:pyrroline-5-carboxylate reductase n=1 Tax=Ensifer sp. M14 TaxID=2203782 RepID=UPI001FCEC899|nr:pyrroline-5-carboxylate reductase [Ensifer sp. M14]
MKRGDEMEQSGGIVLVGCGNMGFALLEGWLDRAGIPAADIHVVEPAEPLRHRAAARGATVYVDASGLPEALQPQAVIVAVKPQIVGSMLGAYRRFRETAVFVSIAAGVPLSTFEATLGESAIVRAMPNMPASIGMGVIAAFGNAHIDEVQTGQVTDLLAAVGSVHWLSEERLVDAATAISGSGPAYLFHFIECLTDAGIAVGLPADTALSLAKQTVGGAAALAGTSAFSPAELRQQVTSPNGTTAAALEVLTAEPGLADLLKRAAEAAHRRALELAVVG